MSLFLFLPLFLLCLSLRLCISIPVSYLYLSGSLCLLAACPSFIEPLFFLSFFLSFFLIALSLSPSRTLHIHARLARNPHALRTMHTHTHTHNTHTAHKRRTHAGGAFLAFFSRPEVFVPPRPDAPAWFLFLAGKVPLRQFASFCRVRFVFFSLFAFPFSKSVFFSNVQFFSRPKVVLFVFAFLKNLDFFKCSVVCFSCLKFVVDVVVFFWCRSCCLSSFKNLSILYATTKKVK
jgi:hypothetical protein